MTSLNQRQSIVLILAITLTLLVSLDYIGAWSGPSQAAPNGNSDTPVHTGADYQAKLGDLGVVKVRAGEYCDASDTNCFTAPIGVGQDWTNVVASRTFDTTYQNTTGRPIMVAVDISGVDPAYGIDVRPTGSGTWITLVSLSANGLAEGGTVIVPDAYDYRVTKLSATATIEGWAELR